MNIFPLTSFTGVAEAVAAVAALAALVDVFSAAFSDNLRTPTRVINDERRVERLVSILML